MPPQQGDRLPVTFLDVAARFSEEEWKLLHEWQKELFKNVMKEIHQALVSLGPLIATSVFSLRAEEKDVRPSDTEDTRRQHISYHPTSSGVSLGKNQVKPQNPLRPPDRGRRQNHPFVSTEDEAVIIIKDEGDADCVDPQDVERSEYTINTAGIHCLNVEAETMVNSPGVDRQGGETANTADQIDKRLLSRCPQNTQELQFLEDSVSTAWSTGNAKDSKKRRAADTLQCIDASTTSNAALGKAEVNVPCSFETKNSPSGQMWSEINQNLEGEKSVQCESELNPTCSSLYTGFYNAGTREQFSENESSLRNELPFTGQKNTKHNWPQYKCNECDKIFKCSMDRIRHMRTHTEDRPFQCSECNKRFRESSTLHRHERIHTGERPFHCAMCPKSFTQKANLISHQRTHTGEKPHQCSVCNKRFSLKGNLIQHMRSHTGERPFQCTDCDRNFSLKSNLTKHQLTHTCNAKSSRKRREADTLQCIDASTTSNAALGKVEVNVPCSFETRISPSGQMWSEINQNLEGEKSVQCESELRNPTCSSLYTGFYNTGTREQVNENESSLRNELPFTGQKNTKHNWPQYKCNECDKIFKCSMDRIRHMRTHTEDRPFQCSECNKRFRQSGALHRHERIHTGERPFHCAMCPKSFNQKENLISHQRTHTGEKPHQCSVCNKRFSLKGNLIQHMRNHTGERPFQCNDCDKNFSKKSNLTKHQLTHT